MVGGVAHGGVGGVVQKVCNIICIYKRLHVQQVIRSEVAVTTAVAKLQQVLPLY